LRRELVGFDLLRDCFRVAGIRCLTVE
jgi:hypothetical protein